MLMLIVAEILGSQQQWSTWIKAALRTRQKGSEFVAAEPQW